MLIWKFFTFVHQLAKQEDMKVARLLIVSEIFLI